MNTSRRACLKLLGISAAGSALADSTSIRQNDSPSLEEGPRQTPIYASADVVVCGGGPAGIGAAVSAARSGASVILIEKDGCLGGIWTSGLLSYWLDTRGKNGLVAELMRRISAADGGGFSRDGRPNFSFDVEVTKLILEELCAENKIQIQYHTRVVGATRKNGRLSHVITESHSGRGAVEGKAFIDCTGNGDLGALAGCSFDLGNPEDSSLQPMSLIVLISGVQGDEIKEFYTDPEGSANWSKPKNALCAAMTAGGHTPSYAKPTLFRVHDDLFILMANHEYRVSGLQQADVTKATLAARKEVHASVNALRKLGGVWKNVRIVATPEQIGIREARRLHGRYKLTLEDILSGRRFDDAVCRVSFCIDIHSPHPEKTKGIAQAPGKVKPYDIPLRALIAKDVEGLYFAGRCISGDFFAHASYRVTGNAVATGEGAGKAAAAFASAG